MTTSKLLQPTMFENGSPPIARPMWMTPQAGDAEFGQTARTSGRSLAMTTKLQSQVRATENGLISSPEVSLANRSVSPGSDWARRMTAISGRSLLPWLPTSSLESVFSRMLRDSSAWVSTRCWLTWKRSVTPAGRSLFLLRPSAPRTGEIASGFWPTPNASEVTHSLDLQCSGDGRETPNKLGWAVAMWPTPTTSEATGPGHTGEGAVNLRTAVTFPTPRSCNGIRSSGMNRTEMYRAMEQFPPTIPTPTARDHKDCSNVQGVPENGLLGRWAVNHPSDQLWPTPTTDDARGGGGMETRMQGRQMNLHTAVKMLPTPRTEGFDAGGHRGTDDSLHSAIKRQHPGKLSSEWVSRLMGLPDGWLNLSDGDLDPLS